MRAAQDLFREPLEVAGDQMERSAAGGTDGVASGQRHGQAEARRQQQCSERLRLFAASG